MECNCAFTLGFARSYATNSTDKLTKGHTELLQKY